VRAIAVALALAFTAVIAAPPTAQAQPAAVTAPLLMYASTHHYPPVLQPTTQAALQKQIARINFDLSKDPPPAENCAQTLGAKRFATLYDDLAQAYSNMAKHAEALEAYTKAIDCNPRADFLHAELAASLLDLGRYTDARMETQRQLHLGRANFTLYTLLTQLDFIDEHWADAIANARIAATMAPNDEQATYWQCFLWLAQLQAGTQDPTLAKRRIAEGWPAPILESLQGKITEEELVEAVSGLNLEQYFQRNILKPLGMNDTSFIFPAEKFDRLVGRAQRQNGGPLQEVPRALPPKPAAFNGGGGLNSTAPDYIKFMQMILRYGRSGVREEILTAKSVEAMSMNQIGGLGAGKLKSFMPNLSSDVDVHPGFVDKWGLGFLINTTAYPGGRSAGSLAWAGVYNTFYWIDQPRGLCAVIMMQFLPFVDKEAMGLLGDFERAAYANL